MPITSIKPKDPTKVFDKCIFLTETQHKALKVISAQRGVKLNNLLFQIIDAYLTTASMTEEEKQELLNPHYHL